MKTPKDPKGTKPTQNTTEKTNGAKQARETAIAEMLESLSVRYTTEAQYDNARDALHAFAKTLF